MRLQHVLVDAAAHQDDDVFQAAAVENGAHLARMRGEVAGIDAHAADRNAVGFEPRRQLHHFARALLGIVGVDQQDDALRPRAREILERGHLVVVHLHEGMRHGADDRHAVALAGEHIGGAGKAREVARACRIKSGLGAVRRAQAEVGQDLARRRQHHARGFGCDQRLVMQNVDEARFDQLRLRQRRGDADQRLVGKADAAFGDRVHVAGEAERGKIIEQVVAETAGAFEPIDLGGGKPQRLQIIERIVEPGGEQKSAPRRQPAHEKLEYRLLVLSPIQIGLDHVEFVEIGEQRTGRGHHGLSQEAGVLECRTEKNGSLGWDRTSDISINSRTLYR